MKKNLNGEKITMMARNRKDRAIIMVVRAIKRDQHPLFLQLQQ